MNLLHGLKSLCPDRKIAPQTKILRRTQETVTPEASGNFVELFG